MVYSLTYRRPPHVSPARASVLGDKKTKSVGRTSIDSQGSVGTSSGIPDALSFDCIIAGGTCPVSLSLSGHRILHEQWDQPQNSRSRWFIATPSIHVLLVHSRLNQTWSYAGLSY